MRTHDKSVLLRLTEQDFNFLKAVASNHNLSVQDFLRDLIHYGKLPTMSFTVDKKKIKKDLTARLSI